MDFIENDVEENSVKVIFRLYRNIKRNYGPSQEQSTGEGHPPRKFTEKTNSAMKTSVTDWKIVQGNKISPDILAAIYGWRGSEEKSGHGWQWIVSNHRNMLWSMGLYLFLIVPFIRGVPIQHLPKWCLHYELVDSNIMYSIQRLDKCGICDLLLKNRLKLGIFFMFRRRYAKALPYMTNQTAQIGWTSDGRFYIRSKSVGNHGYRIEEGMT